MLLAVSILRLHLYTQRAAQVEGFACRLSLGNVFKRNIGTIKANIKLYNKEVSTAFKMAFSMCAGLHVMQINGCCTLAPGCTL